MALGRGCPFAERKGHQRQNATGARQTVTVRRVHVHVPEHRRYDVPINRGNYDNYVPVPL